MKLSFYLHYYVHRQNCNGKFYFGLQFFSFKFLDIRQ